MHDLILLVDFHQENIPTNMRLIKHIVTHPVTKNDLITSLALVTDIQLIKSIKERSEKKIKNLNKKRFY